SARPRRGRAPHCRRRRARRPPPARLPPVRPRRAPGPCGLRPPRSQGAAASRSVLLDPVEDLAEEPLVVGIGLLLQRLLAGGAIELDDRQRHLVAFPARELLLGEVHGELPVLAD